ncbi:ribonuclease HII [Weissella diestrammenae]|uniref:Ribonuclease HII n=1 Tax=Weissella diestrammenae TaxID=1162633 RepID=A0A7G9T4Y2_9LACO|nr:ribonuclease HII [Weissella diestrammenae]MCM0582877.1 ribonuclease HII [Weissella diestrammenae]QNN75157.1 ribonuclease HII [Weissella diestrammenae]
MNKNKTIVEIKQILNQNPSQKQLAEFAIDNRQGVQQLLTRYYRQVERQAIAQGKFDERLKFEKQAWQVGQTLVGVDEVGRGPLAGPVVAAAVIIDPNFDLLEVHDSKQLSRQKRALLAPKIKVQAVDFAYGIVDAEVIDDINIYEASRLAMVQAVNHLSQPIDGLLVDAMSLPFDIPQESLIKGDDRSISIGAASILAKVYRDELMAQYDLSYPGYDFAQNAGYGTREHLVALTELGITPIHRKTFAPVKKIM